MLAPGTIVHERYRIERLVGQGAMGAVYAAVDLRLGQTVALKHTLLPGPGGAEALDREGQILTRLAHPSLPAVTDTFEAAGGQCLVMTYVPGPTLAELLEERAGGFSPTTVCAWADQILVVLEYLHGRSPPVLHRDIKPQNLKLAPGGRVVLLDFGLARGQLFQTQLAGWRSVVGYTLPYAPIEQVRGEDTDPRSDLFALAGTLYHLLVGEPPPDALTRAAALLSGQADPLQGPRMLRPETPLALSTVIVQALALNPRARPADAAWMRAALIDSSLIASEPAAESAAREPRQSPWMTVERAVVGTALLLVAIAAVLLLGWALQSRPGRVDSVETQPIATLPPPTLTPFDLPTAAPTLTPFELPTDEVPSPMPPGPTPAPTAVPDTSLLPDAIGQQGARRDRRPQSAAGHLLATWANSKMPQNGDALVMGLAFAPDGEDGRYPLQVPL